MNKPYTAVGLVPTIRGIRSRKDIKINLEHLKHLVKAANWLSGLSIPVRLIAIPKGALQAFNDEVLDLDHAKFAKECAIDIPGDETEELGKLAREWDCSANRKEEADSLLFNTFGLDLLAEDYSGSPTASPKFLAKRESSRYPETRLRLAGYAP